MTMRVPSVAPQSAAAPDWMIVRMKDSDWSAQLTGSPALLNVGVCTVPVPLLSLWEQSDNQWIKVVSKVMKHKSNC